MNITKDMINDSACELIDSNIRYCVLNDERTKEETLDVIMGIIELRHMLLNYLVKSETDHWYRYTKNAKSEANNTEGANGC